MPVEVGKESFHLPDRRGPVGIHESGTGRCRRRKAGTHTPSFPEAAGIFETGDIAAGMRRCIFTYDLRSPVGAVADEDYRAWKSFDFIQDGAYAPLFVVGGYDDGTVTGCRNHWISAGEKADDLFGEG